LVFFHLYAKLVIMRDTPFLIMKYRLWIEYGFNFDDAFGCFA
jgi:hypothetical protein